MAGYRSLFAFWLGGYGKQQEAVVEPPQPEPLSTGVFGGISPPFFVPPVRPVVGDAYAILPSLDGEIAGEIWSVSGALSGAINFRIDAEVVGEISLFGSVEASVGKLSGGITGNVKFLHDDEEMLLLMLAA